MNCVGAIKNWSPDKGFGFVRPENGGNDVFVHISDFVDRKSTPESGQRVFYTLSQDSKGRVCGKKVKRASDVIQKKPSNLGGQFSLLLAGLFALAIVYAALKKLLPMELVWFLLGINVITFVMYAWDKSSAKSGRWRTQESTLHLVSLLGGWPAAALAQQLIRHKSKKADFRFVFWLTLLINIACFCWLLTAQGTSFLNQWLPAIISTVAGAGA